MWKRSLLLIVITATLFGFSGRLASLQANQITDVEQQTIQGMGMQEIVVKHGTFVFDKLSLDDVRGRSLDFNPFRLRGHLLNNTTKKWEKISFELVVELMDNETKRTATFPFTVESIDENVQIELDEGIRLASVGKITISSINIRFLEGNTFGEYSYSFTITKPKAAKNLVFEDASLLIGFVVTKERIAFTLDNKTQNPIKINWDQVSYVDVMGKAHRVIHSGVRFVERDKSQIPTTLPPTASIEDIILPADHIEYISSSWTQIPLFPNGGDALLYNGRSFNIFMPLEVNGVIKNYLFAFKVHVTKEE